MSAIKIAFHTILAVHYIYGISFYLLRLNPPPEIEALRSSYGGPFKYLTFIDMLLQAFYFTFAFFTDLCEIRGKRNVTKKMKKTRDFLFATLVFSVGAFVSVMFWSLWAINRELIFPKIFDRFFPSWLNHNIHTVPLLGVLLESWITFHNFPTRRQGYLTIALAIGLYATWICFLAFKSGIWVYPILQKLPLIGRTAFMVGMAFLTILFYVLGEYINYLFWGEEIRSIQMRKIH